MAALPLLSNSKPLLHHLPRLNTAVALCCRRSFATLYQHGESATELAQGWSMKHYEKGVRIRFQMPGVTRDQVVFWFERNSLVVKGVTNSGKCYEVKNVPVFRDEFDLENENLEVSVVDGVLEVILPRSTKMMDPKGLRRTWDTREFEDSLQVRIDMPGVCMDSVRIKRKGNVLNIRGWSWDEEEYLDYGGGIFFEPNTYNFQKVKTEMKYGILKVIIPKIKVKNPRPKRIVHLKIDENDMSNINEKEIKSRFSN